MEITMMERLKSLLFIFAIGMLTAAPLSAQAERRIQFPRGKSSMVVKGSTGTAGVTYVLRGRSRQKIVLDLTPANGVGIKVETNGKNGQVVLLREESGGHYEIGLEETGDYTIFVGSTENKPVAFALKIGIARLTDV